MANANPKHEELEQELPVDETLKEEDLESLAINSGLNSPARRLQSYLENQWDERAAEEFVEDRWSIRRMILFVFAICSLFWAGVLYLGQAIF